MTSSLVVPPISDAERALAQRLLGLIDVSPSPWHAVAQVTERLRAAGFVLLQEGERWALQPGGRYVVVREGGALVALVLGRQPLAEAGLRLIGAHTDSPGLRLKPRAPHAADGLLRLGVEVYGGPILATFADRDLGLAGRVHVRSEAGGVIEPKLLLIDQAMLRLPNLAIHMNREVNEQGLKLHKQNELPLLAGQLPVGVEAEEHFRAMLAERLGVAATAIISWELCAFDVQAGAFWGLSGEFLAHRQLDNLASCHAGLEALLALPPHSEQTCVLALFDHEEVGSESLSGAAGTFLAAVLERLFAHAGLDAEDRLRALAHSVMVSADMAHAYHPNFPAAYEPGHKVFVNGGPVIKMNANQRYATSAATAARFAGWCAQAGVPCQQYAHRTDLGCGSTIGPIQAARLGVACVDVGAPMWSMHSARESAGVRDHAAMVAVLTAFLQT